MLLAFRMEEAAESSRTHRLTMVDPDRTYELRDADTGVIGTFEGRELAAGYTVTHPQPRSAALVYITPSCARGVRYISVSRQAGRYTS